MGLPKPSGNGAQTYRWVIGILVAVLGSIFIALQGIEVAQNNRIESAMQRIDDRQRLLIDRVSAQERVNGIQDARLDEHRRNIDSNSNLIDQIVNTLSFRER